MNMYLTVRECVQDTVSVLSLLFSERGTSNCYVSYASLAWSVRFQLVPSAGVVPKSVQAIS
jgi:hypothetical protein